MKTEAQTKDFAMTGATREAWKVSQAMTPAPVTIGEDVALDEAIEAANAVFLKQSLTIGAYESSRTLSSAGGTVAKAQARFDEVMSARGITSATFAVAPAIDSETPPGTQFTISVSAPSSATSLAPSWHFAGTTLSATVTMIKL